MSVDVRAGQLARALCNGQHPGLSTLCDTRAHDGSPEIRVVMAVRTAEGEATVRWGSGSFPMHQVIEQEKMA